MTETFSPFSGRIPYFLTQVLQSPAGSIPKGAQWVLSFDGVYGEVATTGNTGKIVPIEAIKKGTLFEPGKWNIDPSIDATLEEKYQTTKGCMWAQAVSVPGEGLSVNTEGVSYNGYIRSQVGAGRADQNTLSISFLDTNISFVDNTIRAWVIATGHLGMIARTGPDNYRGNVSLYRLGVLTSEDPPFVTQHYQFYGVCPISITTEEWNYSRDISFRPREATFAYHYYTLDTVTGNRFLDAPNTTQETLQASPVATVPSSLPASRIPTLGEKATVTPGAKPLGDVIVKPGDLRSTSVPVSPFDNMPGVGFQKTPTASKTAEQLIKAEDPKNFKFNIPHSFDGPVKNFNLKAPIEEQSSFNPPVNNFNPPVNNFNSKVPTNVTSQLKAANATQPTVKPAAQPIAQPAAQQKAANATQLTAKQQLDAATIQGIKNHRDALARSQGVNTNESNEVRGRVTPEIMRQFGN